MTLARAHLTLGVLTICAFIASGIYLRLALPAPNETNAWLHFAYRSNHIYILMTGLVNLALGLYCTPSPRPRLQLAGSALILIAPFVLSAAFLREPATGDLSRPLTRIGVVLVAIGTFAHAASMRRGRHSRRPAG